MAKIKWGILSTANINRRLIPGLEQSSRGVLHAVASRTSATAEKYAEEWNIPVHYGSYEELLADQEIEVVYIPLPNNLHKEWILHALIAGKHVLCEKPMCLKVEELEEVRQVSNQTGRYVMEAYMHLYHPQTQFWKSIIQSGAIGDVHTLFSNFTFTLSRPEENYRWSPTMGGGALWDVGIYPISLMHFLMDQTGQVKGATQFIQNNIDLSTQAQLEFTNGIAGQFNVSFRSDFSTDTIIHGSKGLLYISHPFTNVDACKAYIRRGDDIEHLEIPRQYLYCGEVEAMHDAILHNKSILADLNFSEGVLKTILEIMRRS